jgi:PhnB protein
MTEYEQVRPAHGQVGYLQLPALDVWRSAEFYAAVFGWQIERPHPSFTAPGLIGQWVADRSPAADAGPLVWISVDHIDGALEAVTANGGVVVTPPAPDDGVRWLSTIRDPAGNTIGIFQLWPRKGRPMSTEARPPVISVMLAVSDAAAAARWYRQALGATELWDLGSVVGLAVENAPFFLGEPENNGWETPAALGSRTVRIEVFVDDPDSFVARAVAAGADGSVDRIRDHQMPWGTHRQGGFVDPFGHKWLVGDRSPLTAHT